MSTIRKKNQDLIVLAASELFATQGYAATKIVDIATAANVPKANVFYYFKNKEILYSAVLDTITEPLLKASKPLEELDDPILALTQYIREKLRISREHPNASKVFANEVMSGGHALPSSVSKELFLQSQMMLSKFNHWIEQGLMDDVSPHHLMFTLWSSTQTYADFSWQICNVLKQKKLKNSDFESAAQFITKLVIQGCGVKSFKPSDEHEH